MSQLSIYDEFDFVETAILELEAVEEEPEEFEDPSQFSLFVVEKPPYVRPTMVEIRAVEKNGYLMASTFSGCGGSCLGFKRAGFDVRYASEFVPAARDTYRANFPETFLDERDIREVSGFEILSQVGVGIGELDVFEGSPPCSSFSVAGRRNVDPYGELGRVSELVKEVKNYSGGIKQRTDDLFDQWIRLIREMRPKVIIAENVPGLTQGAAVVYFKKKSQELADEGYGVSVAVLNASWFGAPTGRKRLFILGVRGRRPLYVEWPTPLPYRYTLRDALAAVERQSPEVLAAVDISRFAIAEAWDQMEVGGKSEIYFSMVRPVLEAPCPTLTATMGSIGAASVCHPTERRKFTPDEAKAISGFPEDFVLTGDVSEQLERVGRAVPPPLSYAIAKLVESVVPLAV